MEMGERIREARMAKGMTMEELGEKLGVSHAAVSRWESNDRKPRLEHLFRLSLLLDVEVNYLIGLRKTTDQIVPQ